MLTRIRRFFYRLRLAFTPIGKGPERFLIK